MMLSAALTLRVATTPLFAGGAYSTSLNRALIEAGVSLEPLSRVRLATKPPQIAHFHWEDQILGSSPLRATSWLAALRAAKLRGTQVVYTMHNAAPHDSDTSKLQSFLYRRLDQLVDAVIVHDAAAAQVALRERGFQAKPVSEIPHGTLTVHGPAVDRDAARLSLGLPVNKPVVLCVGAIRAYKGLPELLEQARCCGLDELVNLIVAGSPVDDLEAQRVKVSAKRLANVRLDLRELTDAELVTYVCASDVVLTGYSDILTSGVAYLALSYARPVVAPRIGGMPAMRKRFGPDWLLLYGRELGECEVEWIMRLADEGPRSEGPRLERWDTVAERTVAFYQRMLAQ